MIKKSEIDYLNYNDLNEIEAKIDQLTEEISKVVISIPTYNKKTWILNELPFIQEIDRIEKAIYNLSEYYIEPKGWQTLKKWITDDNLYPIKSFDYRDWNRWINNLSLMDTSEISNMTLWDGNSLINWNEISDINWIDNNEILIKGKIIELLNRFKIIIKYLKLNGYTKQETTTGKNLFDINGTKSDFNVSTYKYEYNLKPNTQYTISSNCPSSNTANIYANSTSSSQKVHINNPQTITSDSNGYFYILVRHVASSSDSRTFNVYQAILDGRYWLQIEEGPTATEYEQYTGNQPSPSPEYPQNIEVATGSVSVKSTGKNLFDINKSEWGKYNVWKHNAGVYTNAFVNIVDVKGLEKCSISFKNNTRPFRISYQFIDNNDNYLSGNYYSAPTNEKIYADISIPEDASKIIISQLDGKKEDDIKIQLEKGTKTDYEPYKESSITYNLGDNFLADKDYIENGVLNKNIGKVVLDGSENWTAQTTSTEGLYRYNLSINDIKLGYKNVMCDKFITTDKTNFNDITESCIASHPNQHLICIWATESSTLNNFKTWLSQNPVTVYYELATPKQIQLETTGELRTFEPNTIITNSLDSQMEIGYIEEVK